MREFIKAILERKSVRKFTEQPVSREQLEMLARAGMAAPTAANKQPWEFILLTERKILKKMSERLPYAKMAQNAPAGIVVCGNLENALTDWEQEFWIQDCSAATQNILLAAEAMGLGAVWTGVHPSADRIKTVSGILSLPEHLIPLNLIPVGYPAGSPKAKDKFNPDKIHWNAWKQI